MYFHYELLSLHQGLILKIILTMILFLINNVWDNIGLVVSAVSTAVFCIKHLEYFMFQNIPLNNLNGIEYCKYLVLC